MFMRYFHLAILATTVASVLSQIAPESTAMGRQLIGDWGLTPKDGFPVIDFKDRQVVFKYNFTGALNSTKFLEVNLYQSDCTSASDASLNFTESINADELVVDVDIIKKTISQSVHYQNASVSTAIIGFCIRVDYNSIDAAGNTESVNFYETNVTITVDLTADSTLTGIKVARRGSAALVGCFLGFCCCCARRRRDEETEEVVKHHSSFATVSTHPSQGSEYSSSSGQHDNYQARDQQRFV
jgi:hypothetical protein